MKVGFTGTQKGMTDRQLSKLDGMLRALSAPSPIEEFHHGDCIGADEQFHQAVNDPDRTIIHPPEDDKKRAWCHSRHILKPKPYLKRNHDIVDATDVVIATPRTSYGEIWSGTWATIRYAQSKGKKIIIIYPREEE